MATHIAEAIATSQNAFLGFVHILFYLLNRFKLCFLKATIHKHFNTFTVLYEQHDY